MFLVAFQPCRSGLRSGVGELHQLGRSFDVGISVPVIFWPASTNWGELRSPTISPCRSPSSSESMDESDLLGGLRGLYQDLSTLSESSIPNIDRLCVELEAHIQDFRKLLDKPAKNNTSRQAVLSGKISQSLVGNLKVTNAFSFGSWLTTLRALQEKSRSVKLNMPSMRTSSRARFSWRTLSILMSWKQRRCLWQPKKMHSS